jgi:integrase
VARRANGEGTIYRRQDGRYEAAGYFLMPSGIRKRVRVYGKTRAEVHAQLNETLVRARQGVPVPDNNWKLDAYLDYWLETAVRTKRRPLTYRRHEAIVRLYLKPGLSKHTLAGLSVQVVQEFLDRLSIGGQSPANVHQIRKVLSAALTHAMRKELLFRNVARLVELPKYRPNEAEHWDIDETRQFLEADIVKSDPHYAMFVLFALYGLRSGEVRGLRWCDIDVSNSVLRVRQQVQRIDGKLQQVALKTDTSWRDEPLLSVAQSILTERRTKQVVERTATGDAWQGTDTEKELVFTTRTGRPIEARNLYRSFLRLRTRCGLHHITLHGLRHGNGTALKRLKVPERDIQAILGHGSARTTRIYEHVDMQDKTEGLTKVERSLFWRAGDGSRSRQTLPSGHQVVSQIASFLKGNTPLIGVLTGGSSQTRTGDTRLFRSIQGTFRDRLTEVNSIVNARRQQWILGLVAVSVAVKLDPTAAT